MGTFKESSAVQNFRDHWAEKHIYFHVFFMLWRIMLQRTEYCVLGELQLINIEDGL